MYGAYFKKYFMSLLLYFYILFFSNQELTDKESEYVSLSRDTTETDLKQRREITGGTAYHIDQVVSLISYKRISLKCPTLAVYINLFYI